MRDGRGATSQPYPPAGPPYWAPPPKRRLSRWLTVGLPVGVLLVLGGCGTLVVLTINAFTGAIGPVMAAGEKYATALVEQRWDDAHAMLCEDARAAVSVEQLAAHYEEPPLTDYSVDGANVSSSGGQTRAEVTVRFVVEGGVDELTVVPLVREDGDWRPCP